MSERIQTTRAQTTDAPSAPDGVEVSHLEGARVDHILNWALRRFQPGCLAVATSFGPAGLVILDHLRRRSVRLPVVFIDTLHHFPETLDLLERARRHFDLDVRVFRPAPNLGAFETLHGPRLWERDLDRYQHVAKVEPGRRAAASLDAWITGRRRAESDSRRDLPIVGSGASGLVAINPLAAWSTADVWAYIHARGLPFNALHARGYTSIGDEPLTTSTAPGEPERAGRWRGQERLECGMHGA